MSADGGSPQCGRFPLDSAPRPGGLLFKRERIMNPCESALSLFGPLIARWFAERLGEPTDIQRQAWRARAAGEHVLVSLPPAAA